MGDSDSDLLKLIKDNTHRIVFVGVGVSGEKIIKRLKETIEDDNLPTYTFLSSEKHYSSNRKKIAQIKDRMKDISMVFIFARLASKNTIVFSRKLAKMFKHNKVLTIFMAMLPFRFEGKEKLKNAHLGVKRMKSVSDCVISLSKDRLLEISPNTSIDVLLNFSEGFVVQCVESILDSLNKKSMINLDMADLKTVMQDSGYGLIGFGSARGEGKEKKAVEKAIKNPLMDCDITGAGGAFIHIVSGERTALTQIEEAVNEIKMILHPDAKIIWGAKVDKKLGDTMQVALVITGLKEF